MCLFKPRSGAANHQQGTLELKCSELGRGEGLWSAKPASKSRLGSLFSVFLETLSHRQGRFLCRRAAVILKRFNKQYLQFSEVTKTSYRD